MRREMGKAVSTVAFPAPPPERSAERLLSRRELIFLTTEDGDQISAVHLRCPRACNRVVLYSHGNAEDLGQKLPYLDRMVHACATDVLAYEYPGYGLSEGAASEENCYQAIDAAYRYLAEWLDPNRIIAFGRSIGSGPTVDLVARHRRIRGMVLQSPMESGARAALGAVASYVGYNLDIFRNYEKIGRVQCPVLFIHGLEDDVVPWEHSKSLHSRCARAVDPLWVEGRGHNDMPNEECLHRIREFLDELDGLTWGWKNYRDKLKTNLSVHL